MRPNEKRFTFANLFFFESQTYMKIILQTKFSRKIQPLIRIIIIIMFIQDIPKKMILQKYEIENLQKWKYRMKSYNLIWQANALIVTVQAINCF